MHIIPSLCLSCMRTKSVESFSLLKLTESILLCAMLGKAFADEHAARIDSLVQAHAVILRNMFVRAFLRLTLKLTAPPQPIHVGESEDEALTFARGQRESRSWVKDTYAAT